jgi:dTDP-4-amino-4,6-dideoxy-D-galactose acyltransferase
MNHEDSALVEFLPWDSSFFQKRIARIIPNRLTPSTIERIFEWVASHQIDCLYFLADPESKETTALAEQTGFHLTDIRVTLERHISGETEIPAMVRPAVESDLPTLKWIARQSHHDSRFYYDNHFATEQCDKLFEIWIENSYNGFANQTLVADINGIPAGYITCQVEEKEGKIGLLAVHPDHQGKALGSALVNASLGWFSSQGVKEVSVVTQGRNIRAQRLYQRCGFITQSIQIWYHWWNTPKRQET